MIKKEKKKKKTKLQKAFTYQESQEGRKESKMGGG